MTRLTAVCAAVALQVFHAAPSWADPAATPGAAQVVPAHAPERKVSLEPKAAELKPVGSVTFQSDPISDGAIIVVSLGSAGLLLSLIHI